MRRGTGRDCAAGSSYVPSWPMGFCVLERGTDGAARAACPLVTTRSSHASISAACVFGGVRLISSASKRFREDRPGHVAEAAAAPSRCRAFGAGDVAGHEVRGELDALELEVRASPRASCTAAFSRVRHAIKSPCPPESSSRASFDDVLHADDPLAEPSRRTVIDSGSLRCRASGGPSRRITGRGTSRW